MAKNIQGAGKAHPKPMVKTHKGAGNHKRVFKSIGAAKKQAAGSPETMTTGQH